LESKAAFWEKTEILQFLQLPLEYQKVFACDRERTRCDGMFILCLALLWSPVRWAAYYSEAQPPEGFEGFQLLILDSDYHPPLAALTKVHSLLGYISIGEVEQTRSHFNSAKAQGVLLGENQNWKGSFFVDARNAWWRERVKILTRQTLKQGFQGVFLDTVDDAEYLEDKDPAAFRGMKDAMAQLILEVRREFPAILIAVNRGYAILPKVASSVDFVLGESVFSDYDFASKSYRRVPQDLYADQVRILKSAKERNPRLTILTLDYWNPKDKAGVTRIYNAERANGFSPYVSTVELNTIVREPSP